MKKITFIISILAGTICSLAQISPRSNIDFNKDWRFLAGNDSAAFNAAHDDSKWRTIHLPHDWSIESDFTKNAPATIQGGALPGGIGWYRKRFVLPASAKDKKVRIEFDGVYKNSEVWINGHYLGKRPNGYISFQYDLTSYLRPSPAENVIAVKADNSQQPDSRWYSGSGIYRDVRLVVTSSEVAVDHWGSSITTEYINNKKTRINVEAKLAVNKDSLPPVTGITVNIYDKEGRLVHAGTETLRISGMFKGDPTLFRESFELNDPQLWSPHRPYLYKAVIRITAGERPADEHVTVFGIRYFNFDSKKGFFLNGQPFKIQGVCMHHDLGALGAAFNAVAAKRQLKILKEMGCNAIRFSHNPPAAALLDICDEMGFLVMDEAFDIWQKRKNRFDYHLDFKEWHKKDLEDMVLRDRNHPSVFMWSIGNEIREQFDSSGTPIARELVDIVKAIDTTRPVVSALTETMPEKNFITRAGALDILGFNYKYYDYPELPKRFPGQKFIATETASALSTRGVYQFPSDSIRIWPSDYKAQDTFSNSNGNKD
ncbi:MAG: glycoside hydrolase family 2 protein, partial [Chitinophagaceae bacterium]|nr:glycoside hydrolase family 2 protein [Chitinophagaceae bacterium]